MSAPRLGFRLPRSVAAWPSPEFAAVLKRELEALDGSALPLQAGLSSSSYLFGNDFSVMVLGAHETSAALHAKVGVFYQGITAGCNCADDPTPVEAQNEYCEVEVTVDRATAEAFARLA